MVVFKPLFDTIDTTLTAFVDTAANNLATYLTATTWIAATITLIFLGLQLSHAATEIPIRKLLTTFATIAVVSFLATGAGNYHEYIGKYLMALPSEMAVAVTGPPAVDIGTYLDDTFGQIFDGIALIYKKGGISDMGILFAGLMLFLVCCALLVSATIAICMAKVGLALVVGLGPFFIFCLVTPWTKDWFTRWLSYAVHFTVLQALIGGTLLISKMLVENYIMVLANPTWAFNDLIPILSPIVVMLVLAYLFGQLPSMASSLTGGIGLAMGNAGWTGLAGAAGMAAVGARKAGGGAGRGIAWLGNAGAGWGLRQLGGGGNSVSEGSDAQANNAVMRASRTQGQRTAPRTDAARAPAKQSSASAAALARIGEEQRQNNRS